MMKRRFIFLAFCSLVMFGACTTIHSKDGFVVKKRYSEFGIKTPPEVWRKKSFREADLYFEHTEKDASIFIHSECERQSDSPLEALTSQMLGGMGVYQFLSQERRIVQDREALISEIKVNLDGVDRFLKIMVLRKNRCVFDAVLSADSLYPDVVLDFDAVVSSFWAEARQ